MQGYRLAGPFSDCLSSGPGFITYSEASQTLEKGDGTTVQLLLVTSRWPLTSTHEFLDQEIPRLAEVFDRIVVAPMRPDGPLNVKLPPGVAVDRSLADAFEVSTLSGGRRSRRITAIGRLVVPNPAGFGSTLGELMDEGVNRSWLAQSLRIRADSQSVSRWARTIGEPDLAYTFWLGAATVGLRTALPDTPLVSRAHGGDLFPAQHGWHSIPFQRAAVSAVDLLASVSGGGKETLATAFPEARPKLLTSRLGTPDLGGQAPPPAARPLRVISVSSVDRNKRVDLLARVVQRLAQTGEGVEWTHLGDGPGFPDLGTQVASLGLSANVTLKGQVPLSVVHHELRFGNHNVFVNLSLSEGAPMSLMEAQSVGIPVVATRVGGTPEVVPQRWNELVDPSDPVERLAAAVTRAVDRPEPERERRRAHWAENYSAETNYAAWANELRKLALTGRP